VARETTVEETTDKTTDKIADKTTEGKKGMSERIVLERLPLETETRSGSLEINRTDWRNPSTNGNDELAWKFAKLIFS
jgi:hypothetical protein